jgi:hypothetical protein
VEESTVRFGVLFIIGLLLVLPTTTLRADEAPHARAYLDNLNAQLGHVGAQMPMISRAAEQAARAMHAGRGFGVRGDAGLANELSNRAGAMLGYDGRAGEAGDVIVYVFGLGRRGGQGVRAMLVKQIDEADRLRAGGSVVIGIGSSEQIERYGLGDVMGKTCDVFLDNAVGSGAGSGGGAGGGTGAENPGQMTVPTDTVMNAVVAWTFECELFSALTRLDRVPVVRQSFEIDTRRLRWERYGSQRFHHDRWLDPIPPGELGQAYLDGLGDVLLDIGTASWRGLARTAQRVDRTLASGGTVWLRAGGRYLPYHVGGQLGTVPGLFTALNHDGSDSRLAVPGKNDFVLAVGQSETAGSYEWGEPELLRKAGRGVTWVVNGYNTQPRDLRRRETLVDLWGPYGGGVVRVEDYDTRLGPVAGVVGEAVTWMIAAEVVGRANRN